MRLCRSGGTIYALLLMVIGAAPSALLAQSPVAFKHRDPLLEPWRVTRFPELLTRGVRCMAEDADGNFWFGLRDGVVRYDGMHWKDFGQREGLPAGSVHAMCVGSQRRLVAATSAGLYEFRRGQWEPLFPAGPSIDTTEVIEADDQSLWCASRWGLIQYRPEELTLYSEPAYSDAAESLQVFDRIVRLPSDFFPRQRHFHGTDIFIHASTVVSIGRNSPAAGKIERGDRITAVNDETDDWYSLLNQPAGETLKIRVQRGNEELSVTFVSGESRASCPSPQMNAVMQDSQGRIWAGMTHGGLMMTADNGETWQKFGKSDGFWTDSRSFPLEAADGRIFVFSAGKENNVAIFDGQSWTVRSRTILGGNGFNGSAAVTPDGTIYAGGLNRLHVYRDGEWSKHDSRDLRFPSEGHRFLVASDGALWISGFNQAPVRVALSGREFRSILNASHLCTEPSGREWLLDGETKRVFLHEAGRTTSFGPEDGIPDKVAGMVAVPGVGVVATGSHGKLAAASTFDGTKWVRHVFPHVAHSLSKTGFVVSREGKVWIGARGERNNDQVGGVVYGLGEEWQHFRPPDAPRYCTSIIELPDGRTWFIGGMRIREFDGRRWTKLNDPLFAETAVHDATIDSKGTVWTATRSKGVLRYSDSQWSQLDVSHGLPANEVEWVHVDAADQLWVSTRDGLCNFDGRQFHKVHLPMTWGHDRIASTAMGELWFDNRIRFLPDRDPPRLVLDRSALEIAYGGNGYASWVGVDRWNRTPAGELSYSWRIDRGPWSEFSHESGTVIDDLAPGQHALSVRVRDDSGNVAESEEDIAITVLAPFWQRFWFVFSAAVCTSVLIWQAHRLWRRGRDLRQTNRELEIARTSLANQVEVTTAQFRTLCDCSPIGIFATNPEFNLTYINQRLSDFVQRPFTGAESIMDWFRLTVDPDDLPDVEKAWASAVRNQTSFRCTGRVLRPDGSVRWFEVISDRIQRGDVFIGYVGAVDDVTESRQATEALKQTNERLESAMEQLKAAQRQAIRQEQLKALGQMAAGVAHDINNALTPLMNYSTLLESEASLSAEARKWAILIRMGVSDTSETVRRLHHFYRESHNDELLETVNLAEVVRQTIEFTRPRWHDQSQSKRVQIEMETRILAEPHVRADASQLRAVLTNAIFNAVEAIEQAGHIIVTVEIVDEDIARVTVSDNGCGMTAYELEHCRIPFFTTKPSGSGLGLSECHGIIRQHGGELTIDSTEGVGTIVQMDLLRQPAPAEDPSDEKRRVHAAHIATSNLPAAEKLTALCIDDNPLVRQSTRALLNAIGIATIEAEDGASALQLLEQQQPHLVLCDQGLPDIDGLTLMMQIRSRLPNVPVIMVSGWSLPEIEEGAAPDAFLEKPFSINDLRAAVSQFVNLESGRTAESTVNASAP